MHPELVDLQITPEVDDRGTDAGWDDGYNHRYPKYNQSNADGFAPAVNYCAAFLDGAADRAKNQLAGEA